MESCLRSPALSQVYLSLTFQLSQTAAVKGYAHTVPNSVKRSVAESVSDIAKVAMSSTFPTVPVKLNNSQQKFFNKKFMRAMSRKGVSNCFAVSL